MYYNTRPKSAPKEVIVVCFQPDIDNVNINKLKECCHDSTPIIIMTTTNSILNIEPNSKISMETMPNPKNCLATTPK
jgi:hypothetical protein